MSLLTSNLYGLLLVVVAIGVLVAKVIDLFRRKPADAHRSGSPPIVRVGEGIVLLFAFAVVGMALASCF